MRTIKRIGIGAIAVFGLGATGCLSVRAPERINVGNSSGSSQIDTSRVPPTRDHADAREKLAQAYDRIDYLERKVNNLEEDKRELQDEVKEARRRADRND